MVRALDFYPGDLGSNPMRDLGFCQTIHHFLFTNFHIRETYKFTLLSAGSDKNHAGDSTWWVTDLADFRLSERF